MTSHKTDFLPTENTHFKARHNPWIGMAILAIGLLNLVLVIWLMLLTGTFSTGLITGLIGTTVGVLHLTRPYFSLAPNRLTMYNLLGATVKRYPFSTFSDIAIDGRKIVITSTDNQHPETTKIAKWLTHPKDWETVKNMVRQQP